MVHNDEVQNQQTQFTGYMNITAKLWQQHFSSIDIRGLRKMTLATMFVTVALLYIGQLAVWGIFIPITPEGAMFTSTPLSTLAAATAGAIYLWKIGILHSIEMTVVAIIIAHPIQSLLLPIIFSWDISYGETWIVFAYIAFAISLLLAYILAYIFFNSWRAPYKTKLIIAVIFIAITIAVQIILRTGE